MQMLITFGVLVTALLFAANLPFSSSLLPNRPLHAQRNALVNHHLTESLRIYRLHAFDSQNGEQVIWGAQAEFGKQLYLWLKDETLETLIPRDLIIELFAELREKPETTQMLRSELDLVWSKLTQRLASESRSIRQIIGDENTAELLNYATKVNSVYDPVSIKALLGAPVFENMIGGVLYEAIFMFLQRVDLIGNIINRLPVIGPIRKAIVEEFKRYIDNSIGGQIKSFLASFNKIAVQRIVDFVLSDKNREAFQRANQNLLRVLVDRPFNELVPDANSDESLQLKEALWRIVTKTEQEDIAKNISKLYDRSGSSPLSNLLRTSFEVDLQRTESGQRILSKSIVRLLATPEGKAAFAALEDLKKQADAMAEEEGIGK